MTAAAACPDRRPDLTGGLQGGAHWGPPVPQEVSVAHTDPFGRALHSLAACRQLSMLPEGLSEAHRHLFERALHRY